MQNLETIGGNVMAWSTGADFRSLSNLRSIGGSLDIYGLGARGTLGLVSLREIGGEAALRDLSPLEDIGLPRLESVGGKFVLSGAEGLTEMVGMDSLRQVGGNLAIGGNRDLPSEKVYEWLDATRPAVDGDIIVCNNLDGQSEPCPPPPTP